MVNPALIETSLEICSRGAELAVQSQQRRWDDATRHPQLQPALSSAATDEWVLSWRLNEASDSSGDRRAVGSRFQVLEPYAAKPQLYARRTECQVNVNKDRLEVCLNVNSRRQ